MSKQLTLSIFFLVSFYCHAQDYKFGKVSKEELMEKFNPRDSTANATILYKEELINFNFKKETGFQQTREVHERIKIYNKEGFKWATKRIRLYNRDNSNGESLHGLKGYTYNLVDGKIEDEKLASDGQFEDQLNKYWKNSSFTMPNIKEGCVIEYQYKISSPFMTIRDVNFQYEIPVNKFDLSISTPEYFIYNKHINPLSRYYPKLRDSKKNKSVTITNKNRNTGAIYQNTKRTFSSQKLDYLDNVIKASEDFIPALKKEPYVDNLDNYRSKLALEITATNFPNSVMEHYSISWDDVTKTIYNNDNFGSQLNRQSYFKDDIDQLLAGKNDELEKAQAIFDFVKSNVKWNKYVGYSSENGVRKAYIEGEGNVADINLMLVAMLRYAGITADPVLISTKNNGIPLFPTLDGFNYVACLLQTENLNALLDASDPFSEFNVLPERALNWQGRLVQGDGSSTWISMLPVNSSFDVVTLSASIDEQLECEGKVRKSLSNHYALEYMSKYKNLNPQQYISILEKDRGDVVIENLEISNANDISEPINVQYEFKSSEGIEEVGDKIFLEPMLFLTELENEFLQEDRSYPIDFKFPFKKKHMINIKMPEGYTVDSKPDDVRYQFLENGGHFSYQIHLNGNFLQIISDYSINSSFIIPENYKSFKEFYNLVLNKQAEQLVLKKI